MFEPKEMAGTPLNKKGKPLNPTRVQKSQVIINGYKINQRDQYQEESSSNRRIDKPYSNTNMYGGTGNNSMKQILKSTERHD